MLFQLHELLLARLHCLPVRLRPRQRLQVHPILLQSMRNLHISNFLPLLPLRFCLHQL